MITREIAYSGGHQTYHGFLAAPNDVEKHPAILVAHEAPGLSPHIRNVAMRLAEEGYVAFALDYIGEGRVLNGLQQVMIQITQWSADPSSLRTACKAAHELLISLPEVDSARISGYGYCFGAQALLEYARTGSELAAIVGFHPGLGSNRPDESRLISSRLLMFIGSADPITPLSHRVVFEDEMSAAGVDWRMIVYSGVGHAFTSVGIEERGIPGFAYNKEADIDSWRTALEFLKAMPTPTPTRSA